GHQLPPTWCGTTTVRTATHVAGEGDGHPRPADLASITVAKSVCGASDWHRASGVRRPGAGLWRGAPATNSFFLRGVLQRGPHALGARQGCASRSGSATDRGRCSHPNLVWPASPLRSDIIFAKHRLIRRVRRMSLFDAGQGLRPFQRGFFRLREVGALAPCGESVEALVGLTGSPQVARVFIDAIGAPIDLTLRNRT